MTGSGDESAEFTEFVDPLDTAGKPIAVLAADDAPRGIDGAFTTKRRQEEVPGQRYTLAVALLIVTALFSLAAATLALVSTEQQWGRLDALLPLLITPFQTLLGAAIGWYFGAHSKDK
ncbi:hypothetical protein [Sanguibacter suarezii]|uniref:hypothetical protein n=1 Tax=Sanguibacter suarezii TaxID=60921 RepID=UPI00082BCCD3|nr:hypothetical protein [Sanguibacter suarezii]